jgi:amino acid transporter
VTNRSVKCHHTVKRKRQKTHTPINKMLYGSTNVNSSDISSSSMNEDSSDAILSWNVQEVKGCYTQLPLTSIQRELSEKQQALYDSVQSNNSSVFSKYLKCWKTNASEDNNSNAADERNNEVHEHKLSELPATAICGNDITASCLYVVGVCTLYAGFWAPLCLLMVACLLYLFKSIYTEVGSAIALNGASYTLLLNTTSKKTASLAACLTIISYLATAVVSASTAIEYVRLLPYCHNINLFWATVGLLALFAVLSIIGITESAITALIIFVFHIICLTILVFYCSLHTLVHDKFRTLVFNWYAPAQNNIFRAIFYGFGAAMLGVTGFESSANFIEQQKPGVFPKTLRNMWVIVSIFNPLISFLSLCVMPLSEIVDPSKNANLLSQMGMKAAGRWLQILLSLDAFLVLSGSVLTGYVGIVGLLRQMAMDRCFPSIFLRTNRLRGTNHYIIICFFIVCVSMILVLGQGQIANLAGVYTISFLSVMFLFAFGDLLLKYKRSRIHRVGRASKTVIVIAMVGVLVALTANISMNPEHFVYFVAYYSVCAVVVLTMLWRVRVLKFFIFVIYKRFKNSRPFLWIVRTLISHAKEINSQSVIYYCKDDSLEQLNKAVLYVRENELSGWLRIVHIYHPEEENYSVVIDRLKRHVETLDEMYRKMRIDFVAIQVDHLITRHKNHTPFGPEIVKYLEEYYSVRKNLMFISCPSSKFKYKVADFQGLRIITSD